MATLPPASLPTLDGGSACGQPVRPRAELHGCFRRELERQREPRAG